MARNIQQQLLDAFTASDVPSYAELGRRAKLDLTGDSISRKLRGKQVMSTREAETFARTLGATIHFSATPSRRAA